VRQDDALIELLESQGAEDGAAAQRPAFQRELLVVDVEPRLEVLDKRAVFHPGFEVAAGEGVVIGAGQDIGAVLPVIDAGEGVRAAGIEVEASGAGNDVVRRRDQACGVTGDVGVVAQGAQGSKLSHEAMIGGCRRKEKPIARGGWRPAGRRDTVTCNQGETMNRRRPKASREKVNAHRERLKRRGLRPVQFWVPDARSPEFEHEARRQSLAVAMSAYSRDDQAFIEAISDSDAP
jgi:hypothetical protein